MTRHRFDKARSRKGETMAEVLVSLLVVTLAALLMATMVSTSGSINLAARKMDEKFYEALSKVESVHSETGVKEAGVLRTYKVLIEQNLPAPATPVVTDDADVYVYTSEDLTLYKEVGP